MGIAGAMKLNEIKKENIEKVGYSDQGNLVIRYKGKADWCFVYDNQGNRIIKGAPKQILEKGAAGNEDILNYLLEEAEKK
jgi:hypothetical protein